MSPNLPSVFVCMRTRFLVASADVRVVLCVVLILAVAGGYAFAAMVLFGHQFNEVSEFGSAISNLFDIILVMDTCMYSCSLHSCHPSISPSDTVQADVYACTRDTFVHARVRANNAHISSHVFGSDEGCL